MKAKTQKGFTLIEVLVAFGILSVSLTVFYQTVATSMQRQEGTEKENLALSLAKSQLALVGEEIPLKGGDISGEWQENFAWQITISPRPDQNSDFWLYDIMSEVRWDAKGDEQKLQLETVMIGEAGEGS